MLDFLVNTLDEEIDIESARTSISIPRISGTSSSARQPTKTQSVISASPKITTRQYDSPPPPDEVLSSDSSNESARRSSSRAFSNCFRIGRWRSATTSTSNRTTARSTTPRKNSTNLSLNQERRRPTAVPRSTCGCAQTLHASGASRRSSEQVTGRSLQAVIHRPGTPARRVATSSQSATEHRRLRQVRCPWCRTTLLSSFLAPIFHRTHVSEAINWRVL